MKELTDALPKHRFAHHDCSWFCAASSPLLLRRRADVRLPSIIGDNMVLQAGDVAAIWGWADPNEEINVSRQLAADGNGRSRPTRTASGRSRRSAPDAGGPYEMTVKGKNTVTLKNVLVGEVWVCSGQSNMEMAVRQLGQRRAGDRRGRTIPKIRLFTVAKKVADKPQDDCKGKWVVCSPETVGGFSAVGYFFGRELHKELNVPVGLIHTSWGGTPAESWTSPSMLEANPDFEPIVDALQRGPGRLSRRPRPNTTRRLDAVEEGRRQGQGRGKPAPAQALGPAGPGQPAAPGRPLQRHDRPAGPLRHPRRDLVPGRVERRPRLPVPRRSSRP